MNRDSILIRTERPADAVAATIGRVLDASYDQASSAAGDFSGWGFDLGDSVGWLDRVDYVDEDTISVPLSSYQLELQIEAKHGGAASAAARRVYRRLVAGTDWGLALFGNDVQQLLDARAVVTAA